MNNFDRNSEEFQRQYLEALSEIKAIRESIPCYVTYWDDGSVVKDEDFQNLSPEEVIAIAKKALGKNIEDRWDD